MKWHYSPLGFWQLTHSDYCGSHSRNGILTTQHKDQVTCTHCLKKMGYI